MKSTSPGGGGGVEAGVCCSTRRGCVSMHPHPIALGQPTSIYWPRPCRGETVGSGRCHLLSDTGSGRPSSMGSSHYTVMMGMAGSGLIYVLCTCTSWLSRRVDAKPYFTQYVLGARGCGKEEFSQGLELNHILFSIPKRAPSSPTPPPTHIHAGIM